MRTFIQALVALLILSIPICARQAAPPAQATMEATARRLVEAMAAGDFTGATADFNATMKGALSPAQLQAAWQSLTPQAGAFKQVVASTSSVPYYSDALNETAARYEAGVIAHQLDLIPGRPDHYRSRY